MIPRGAPRLLVLEWGTATEEPGSVVLDAEGRMIFTGSAVESLVTGQQGLVVELLTVDKVRVAWLLDATPARTPSLAAQLHLI